MSEQISDQTGTIAEKEELPRFRSVFLSENAPPVIEDPYSVPIEDINPVDPRLFQREMFWEHFRRLRMEDPVHLNELHNTGRYWSITKFNDIMWVDRNHELFSSAKGIALGPKLDYPRHPDELVTRSFIDLDPPEHDLQRATVSGVVAPPNLAKMEDMIRERTGDVLDNLPELVVKEVHGSGGYGMLVGPQATKAQIDDFAARLRERPGNYIAQPTLALSATPTFTEAGIAPRHVDLRPFCLVGERVELVPGGLTRVALSEGSLVVNSSQGGGVKDTWVLAE